MSDPEVVDEEVDPTDDSTTSEKSTDDRRRRRRYGWLALLLLLLLLCCCTSAADVLITRGPQQARFIARNLECLQCHTEKIPDFSKNTVHAPFMQRDCTICHVKHTGQVAVYITQGAREQILRYRTLLQWLPLRWWFGLQRVFGAGARTESTTVDGGGVVSQSIRSLNTSEPGLVMPKDKLCWMCHGDMGALLGDEFIHLPFEKGRCTECHDPHASDFRALLTQAPNKICFTCHPMGLELNRMQTHPPAKQGWCTDCHNPHASNHKGILVSKQRDLCFTCHPTIAPMSKLPTQHQPFKNDNCTGCHEPHGSDNSPLLINAVPKLCYICHPQIENQFGLPSHHPIGLTLTCVSCHNPHAALYPGLLSGSSNWFCYECHGDKQAMYDASKHAPKECVRCHTPHGSDYKPMLLAAQPELCLRCHPKVDGSNKHPIRAKYYDIHAEKGLSCTSSCHNPHGTEYDPMMKNYDWKQDGLCLQCHKTVGVYY